MNATSRSRTPSERSPLLASSSPAAARRRADSRSNSRPTRWCSVAALATLCITCLVVLAVGFVAPAAAERYARESVDLKLSSVGIESFTDVGFQTRIQGELRIDARNVQSWSVRTLGRASTWMMKRIKTGDMDTKVSLPDYSTAILAVATVPGMVIGIKNQDVTPIDVLLHTKLISLGPVEAIAEDFLQGNLRAIRLKADAIVPLKTGFLSLGMHQIQHELLFRDIPSAPDALNITDISVREEKEGEISFIRGSLSATILNPYPVEFEIPPLGFSVSIPGCGANELIGIASAKTHDITVKPKTEVLVHASGALHSLPANVTTVCPSTDSSPMDHLLGLYLHGEESTLYISGERLPDSDTPEWLSKLLTRLNVPVSFPGRTLDGALESFDLSEVSMQLPDPNSNPGDPSSHIRLSATVHAIVLMPQDLQISLDIKRMNANVSISYEGQDFGILDIKEWLPTKSHPTSDGSHLEVEASVHSEPLDIIDYAVFQRLLKRLAFSDGTPVALGVDALVNAEVATALGVFVVRGLPASGNITLDELPDFETLPMPKVLDIAIGKTHLDSLSVLLNLTVNNPTNYEALIPYASVHMTHRDVILADAVVENQRFVPGNNSVYVTAQWNPLHYGGSDAKEIGRQLMSHYISGDNVTVTLRAHNQSIPSLPALSEAISFIELTLPMPHLPHGNDDDAQFIESATMHIFSSTAELVLRNPLPHNSLTIADINATATYNETELGQIKYHSPFRVKPGLDGSTSTPRLPVNWDLDGVAYEVVKKALGGRLEIHAEAWCEVLIGTFSMKIFYNSSHPILARIRI